MQSSGQNTEASNQNAATSSGQNTEASPVQNAEVSNDQNVATSSGQIAGPSANPTATSPESEYDSFSEATVSEATRDRIIRLESSCTCCGLPSESHTRSECPCADPRREYKTHTLVGIEKFYAEDRKCCACGTEKGELNCTNCECTFCSGHCLTHQVSSALHSNPESPTGETSSYLLPRTLENMNFTSTEDEIREAFEKLDREQGSASNDNKDQTKSLEKRNREDSDSDYEGKGKKPKH